MSMAPPSREGDVELEVEIKAIIDHLAHADFPVLGLYERIIDIVT